MKKQSIWLAALACILTVMFAATGCAVRGGSLVNSPAPTSSATAKATAGVTDGPTASPMASATADEKVTDSASPSASAGDTISGFMEGGIIDPDDVPDIVKLFAEGEEYAGAEIQSITYKLHEGRQAYYVVLQGAGSERRFYVLPDLSVISADENN